jgi:hypothetical protein
MSGHEHLSDDVLLDALYGLTEIGSAVRECPSCAARWTEMNQQRARLAQAVDVSSDFLAAQRREIYERLSRPEPRTAFLVPRWAAVLSVVCVIAIGLFWFRAPKAGGRAELGTEVSDTQLFADVSEVYSLEESFEPAAAAPIRALFEEGN